jgi:hypothetical protein
MVRLGDGRDTYGRAALVGIICRDGRQGGQRRGYECSAQHHHFQHFGRIPPIDYLLGEEVTPQLSEWRLSDFGHPEIKFRRISASDQ